MVTNDYPLTVLRAGPMVLTQKVVELGHEAIYVLGLSDGESSLELGFRMPEAEALIRGFLAGEPLVRLSGSHLAAHRATLAQEFGLVPPAPEAADEFVEVGKGAAFPSEGDDFAFTVEDFDCANGLCHPVIPLTPVHDHTDAETATE